MSGNVHLEIVAVDVGGAAADDDAGPAAGGRCQGRDQLVALGRPGRRRDARPMRGGCSRFCGIWCTTRSSSRRAQGRVEIDVQRDERRAADQRVRTTAGASRRLPPARLRAVPPAGRSSTARVRPRSRLSIAKHLVESARRHDLGVTARARAAGRRLSFVCPLCRAPSWPRAPVTGGSRE